MFPRSAGLPASSGAGHSQQEQSPSQQQQQQQQQPYALVPPPPSSQRQRTTSAPTASSPAESSSSASSASRTTSTNGPAPAVSPVETADYAVECKQCAPPVWLKTTAGLRRHRNKEHITSVQVTVPDGEVYRVTRVDGVFTCAVCGHASKDCEYLPAHVKRRPKLCSFVDKWSTVSLPASWERVDSAAAPSYAPASSTPSNVASSSAPLAPAPAYNTHGPAHPSAMSVPPSNPARPPPIHTFGYDTPSYALAGGSSSSQPRPQQQQQQQFLGVQGYSHPGQQPYPYQQYPATAAAASRPAPQPNYPASPPANANIYNSMTGRFVADSAPSSGAPGVSGGPAGMPSPAVATPSTASSSVAAGLASSARPAGTIDSNALRALLKPEVVARMSPKDKQTLASYLAVHQPQHQPQHQHQQQPSSTTTPAPASVQHAPGLPSMQAAWSQPTAHSGQAQHQAASSSAAPASASTYMAAALNAPPSAERQHLLTELASSTADYGSKTGGGSQQRPLSSGPSQQPSTVAEALNAQSRMVRPADLIQLAAHANETNRQEEEAQRSPAVGSGADAHSESFVGAPEDVAGGQEDEALDGEQYIEAVPAGEEPEYSHAVAPQPDEGDGDMLQDADRQLVDAGGVSPWAYGEGAPAMDLREHSPQRPPAVPAAAMPSVRPASVMSSSLQSNAGSADAENPSPPSSAGAVVDLPRADGGASGGETATSDDSSVLEPGQVVAAPAADVADGSADDEAAAVDGAPEIDESDFTQTGRDGGGGRESSAALEAQQEREQSHGSTMPLAPSTDAAHVDLRKVGESGGQEAGGEGGVAGGREAADGF